MLKIVFLDKSTVGDVSSLSCLKSLGKVTFWETTPQDMTLQRTRDAEVVITNKVVIDKKVMDASPALRLICIAATGMNNVDLEYARKKGVMVKNVSGYSTLSVTQSTFAMVLLLQNALLYYDDYVKTGLYADSPIFTHLGQPFNELQGKIFGILGMGSIGRSVAQVAQAFGCKVVYYTTSGKNVNQPYESVSLEELLRRSDIVSIHAPLNERTHNLIDLSRIKLMKKDAILINMGRGNIVKEADLAYALDEGLIRAAGLDVYAQEPLEAESPLLKVKNKQRLVLTPHTAWASVEAREELVRRVCHNIRDFLSKNQT